MPDSVNLTAREGTVYVSDVSPALNDKLKAEMSFRPAGYEFSPAYKRKQWDGWKRLYKNYQFPVGLLHRVCSLLEREEVSFDLDQEEKRREDLTRPSLGLPSLYEILRPYQLDAVQAAVDAPHGVIQAPTGSGKSLMIVALAAQLDMYTLIVVPTIDLLHQFRDTAARSFGIPPEMIGQLGDGVVDPQPLTVATTRTAAKAAGVAYARYEYSENNDADDTDVRPRELRDWLNSVGVFICDETPILAADTVFALANSIPADRKYGFSASPWRDDGADLMIEAAAGPILYRVGTSELVRGGYLMPPIIREVDTTGWWRAKAWDNSQFSTVYKHEIVENDVRNARIAEIVNELVVPTLVLVKQIAHGYRLQQLIPESLFLSGKDPGKERADAYQQLRDGERRVVICSTVADQGIDIPHLGALVLCGAGKSTARHLQRIGRVTRPSPGKKAALVVDFRDTFHRWFRKHADARREIEIAEWGEVAIWI
jgi:superfamily II DNA or RNA helicase